MNKEKVLIVRINNEFIGWLSQNEVGKIEFDYQEACKRILSLSLPLTQKHFTEKQSHAYFEGLLPESEDVRKAVAQKFGVNHNNFFSLLKVIGYDCAGAVSFHPYEDNPQNLPCEFKEVKGKIFSEEELYNYIKELPKKPLFTSYKGLRLSLAGAQEKTAIICLNGEIGIPDFDVPTTHILKPAMKDYEESVENEFICMTTAKNLGLAVSNTSIGQVKDIKYLLVERYDRHIENNKIKRIHQEDFCQCLNIPSRDKYQCEGGVSTKNCYEIIRKTDRPILNIQELTKRIIFNYLIGNADAHGKNFSILHLDNGGIEFAPAYDILCTQVYPELIKNMAMKIGGCYEPDRIFPKNWEIFAQEADINYAGLRHEIIEMAQKLPAELEIVVNSFKNTIGNKILAIVKENCERTLRRFEEV